MSKIKKDSSIKTEQAIEPLTRPDNVGLTFGILSIIFSFTSVLGLLFGFIGLKKSKIATDKKLNKIGIIISFVFLVLIGISVCVVLVWVIVQALSAIVTGTVEGVVDGVTNPQIVMLLKNLF